MFGDNDKKAPKLRLLKVVVQPVMVVDDGESLREVSVEAIVVQPNEWPNYPTGRFTEQIKELQAQLDAGQQQTQSSAAPASPGNIMSVESSASSSASEE